MMKLENEIMEMSKKLILVITGLSLGACSSVEEKNSFMTFNDLQTKVLEHDEQWQSVQPKLDRIDALEAEVAALKQDKMALINEETIEDTAIAEDSMDASNAVAETMTTDVASVVDSEPMDAADIEPMMEDTEQGEMINSAPLAAAPLAVAPLKTEPVMASKSEYGVQLASYKNRDEAIRGWNVLMKKDPASFKGLDPLVNQKEVNGRDMYQLKVGPFLNKSFSSDFCKMLQEKGHNCFVTQYNGDVFTAN
jgi:cell division protein FtsN